MQRAVRCLRFALLFGALSLLTLSVGLAAVAIPSSSSSSISQSAFAFGSTLSYQFTRHTQAIWRSCATAVSTAGPAALSMLRPIAERLVQWLNELRVCLTLESSCEWWR